MSNDPPLPNDFERPARTALQAAPDETNGKEEAVWLQPSVRLD